MYTGIQKKYRRPEMVSKITPEYSTQFLAVVDPNNLKTIYGFIFFNFCSQWIKEKQTLAQSLNVEAENYLFINYLYVINEFRGKRLDLMLVNYCLNFEPSNSSIFACFY